MHDGVPLQARVFYAARSSSKVRIGSDVSSQLLTCESSAIAPRGGPGLGLSGDEPAAVVRVVVCPAPPYSLQLVQPEVMDASLVVSRTPVLASPLVLRVLDRFGNLCSTTPGGAGGGTIGEAPPNVVLTLQPVGAPATAPRAVLPAVNSIAAAPTDQQPDSSFAPLLYPDGRVALSAPVRPDGTALFPRVELLSGGTSAAAAAGLGGPGAGEAWWQAGGYTLRAELRQEQEDENAHEDRQKQLRQQQVVVAYERVVDVFPDASEQEAGVLRQQRGLVERRAKLAEELALLERSGAAADEEYRARRDQLRRLDDEVHLSPRDFSAQAG